MTTTSRNLRRLLVAITFRNVSSISPSFGRPNQTVSSNLPSTTAREDFLSQRDNARASWAPRSHRVRTPSRNPLTPTSVSPKMMTCTWAASRLVGFKDTPNSGAPGASDSRGHPRNLEGRVLFSHLRRESFEESHDLIFERHSSGSKEDVILIIEVGEDPVPPIREISAPRRLTDQTQCRPITVQNGSRNTEKSPR